MTVRVTVPEGLNRNLYAEGPGYFTGVSESFTSTGEEQTVSITMSTPLPNTVGVLSGSMDWSVCDGENDEFLGTTGPHKIYLTLGEPITPITYHPLYPNDPVLRPNVPTEKRMDWACGVCQDQSTLRGVADAVYDKLCGEGVPLLSPGTPHLVPIWSLLSGETATHCIGLATLMEAVVTMVGGEAGIGYIYASTDTQNFSTNWAAFEVRDCNGVRPPEYGGPAPHSPPQEELRVKHGGWQRWEGVCVAGGWYYGVRLLKADNPFAFLRSWLEVPEAEGQYWMWLFTNPYGQRFGSKCKDPGPSPVPLPEP